MKQPPYVFKPDSNECSIRARVYNDLQIFVESKDFTHCFSLTLTLTPAESNILKKNGADITGYFKFLLENYNISGTHIIEFTKKGVQHLHGIFYFNDLKKDLIRRTKKYRKKYDIYYTWDRIQSQHVIKPINSYAQYKGWLNYMVKNQISTTVLTYLQMENNL